MLLQNRQYFSGCSGFRGGGCAVLVGSTALTWGVTPKQDSGGTHGWALIRPDASLVVRWLFQRCSGVDEWHLILRCWYLRWRCVIRRAVPWTDMRAPHMVSQHSHRLLRWIMWAWHLTRQSLLCRTDHVMV